METIFDDEDDFFVSNAPETKSLPEFVAEIPLYAPTEIFERLENLGYRGQIEPRRAMSLMAYRHIKRLKNIHLANIPPHELPPKQNMLLLGATGSGKTFLVELLFQEIFRLPTVIVDSTTFSETGYVGDSVGNILTRLLIKAEGRADIASCGVICLDEFDKLASASSNARFAGQGTTKDVSGYGVQRELLAMIQGANVNVAMDYGFSEYGARTELSTHNVPFIACGAFSGFDELAKENRSDIGFRQKAREIAETLTEQQVTLFQKYGFLPELIGRFARIVAFPPLEREFLLEILTKNIVPQFKREFAGENLSLEISDEALKHIVERGLKRKTGARSLHTELMTAIEKAAFETFGAETNAVVRVEVENEKLVSRIN